MSVPQNHLFGGICPLGIITVTTSGVPVPITQNVGSQQAGQGTPWAQAMSGTFQGRPFSGNCRQLILSTPGNSGVIYINYGNVAGLDANATMLVIAPNQIAYLPTGMCDSNIDVTSIWVDAASSSDIVVVAAADGS
jgi:hypothetical protein